MGHMHPLSSGRSADVVERSLGREDKSVSPLTYLESYIRLFIDARKSEPLIESSNGAQDVGTKGHVASFNIIDKTCCCKRGIPRGKT
jgi:hypothetical protein